MRADRLHRPAWVAIYVGMAVFALGVSIARTDDGIGWSVATVGGVLVLIGVLLVWWRSRMKDDAP